MKNSPLLVLCWRTLFPVERAARDHVQYTIGLGGSVVRIGHGRKFLIQVLCRRPSRWRAVQKQAVRQTPEANPRDYQPALFYGFDEQEQPLLEPLTPEEADAFAADPAGFLNAKQNAACA